jgi:hypothetical protein
MKRKFTRRKNGEMMTTFRIRVDEPTPRHPDRRDPSPRQRGPYGPHSSSLGGK